MNRNVGKACLMVVGLLMEILTVDLLVAQEVEVRSKSEVAECFSPSYIMLKPPPKMRASYAGLGGVVLKDDYLSPLNYGGLNIGVMKESFRRRYKGTRLLDQLWGRSAPNELVNSPAWVNHWQFFADLSTTQNPAGNANIYRIQTRWSYARLYPLLAGKWGSLAVGPSVNLGLGGLYSTRNGNNPANLKADANLSVSALYSYRIPIPRFPIALRANLQADLLGTQWSQHFGESYYEFMYLRGSWNERFQLVHLGNQQSLRFALSLDLPLLKGSDLSLAYRMQYRYWAVNQLPNKQVDHTVYVGWVRYLTRVSGSRNLPAQHYF